jgi:tRNA threonylcarbamoyladenosine biosynthesis protein TsaB
VTLLAIETSTPNYAVAVATSDATVVRTSTRTDADFDGIAGLVATALRDAEVSVSDLDGVVVDRGPGNLISVRAGLTFACGLAYAAKLPIHAANSLEILARTAVLDGNAALPILATRPARRITADLVYAGIFDQDGGHRLVLGQLGDIAKEFRDSYSDLYVAGVHQDIEELIGSSVRYTGVQHPSVQGLLALMQAGELPVRTDGISPLTEESEEFRARA